MVRMNFTPPADILEETFNGAFSVYPNPAHDYFTITENKEFSKIKLINLDGQVFDNLVIDNHQMINIEGINPAIIFFSSPLITPVKIFCFS